MKSPTAIILAAGKGTRLASMKLGVPKPLAPIAGKPFIFYQLEWLRFAGYRKVVIAISKCSIEIRKVVGTGREFKMSIRYSFEHDPHGTAVSLRHARALLPSSFTVVNGDTFCSFQLLDFINSIFVKHSENTLALVRKPDTKRYGRVILDSLSRIINFAEKEQSGSGLVYAGVAFLQHRTVFAPQNRTATSLEYEVYPALIKEKKLYGIQIKGNFWDIGTPQSYRYFKRTFLTQKQYGHSK